MSSALLADVLFVLELRQRIVELQTELTKVMNAHRPASERDALIGAIAELKMARMQHLERQNGKPAQTAFPGETGKCSA